MEAQTCVICSDELAAAGLGADLGPADYCSVCLSASVRSQIGDNAFAARKGVLHDRLPMKRK
jgi:hypothetical protein